MRIFITSARIRALLDGIKTEHEITATLRRHHIKYAFSTAGGILHISIPARSGKVTVTRTANRANPFRIASAPPHAYINPIPYSWDD